VFAITNAVPAIGLLYYGFLNKGLVPGLCFGAVSLFSLFRQYPKLIKKRSKVFCFSIKREAIVNWYLTSLNKVTETESMKIFCGFFFSFHRPTKSVNV